MSSAGAVTPGDVILGIWDGHDSGAALLVGGRVVAAANEERFTRRKLEIRFPARSIAACLEIAGLAPTDVTLVACSTIDPAKTMARWFPSTKEAYYAVRRRKAAPGRLAEVKKRLKYRITEWRGNRVTAALSRLALRRELARCGITAPLRLFDHHHCHAVAAALASGFERCAVLTIDGVGDGLSATVSSFADRGLRRIAATPARDSLGVFFEHVTTALNMRELEDEGKVMALADYSAPVEDRDNPLLPLVGVQGLEITLARAGHGLARAVRRVQWHVPNEQLAAMAQRVVERTVVRLAHEAVRATGCDRLAIAGGVASNIKATRAARQLPEVGEVYVFPHMGDGGLALGAALAAAADGGQAAPFRLDDLALGPAYDGETVAAALRSAGLAASRPADLPGEVAALLAGEKVVLWFEGRMEYGPRALGQRSVLARADRPALRDRLNLLLKRRVWYQPFCPSLLESEARRAFVDLKGAPSRHMTAAYLVGDPFRAALAGVTGIDGSCRPQVVPDDAPGPFAALLRAMRECAGFGAVLNTSFNIHGEPLVCTPAEAVEVYRRCGADALAIEGWLVRRDNDA